VEISYLCDVDRSKFARATAVVEDARGRLPKRVQDFREILADDGVDAVVIATGHNWHALATIWACQAGKDVYVEKPMALTLHEGRKMVEAARKHGRVVQVGSQTESNPFFLDALAYVRSGKLGAVRFARTQIMEPARISMFRDPLKPGQTAPVPPGLDWDMFCGPAPLTPYYPGPWWTDLWDYTLGGLIDHSAHQLSMIRQFLDLGSPKAACAIGRILRKPGEDTLFDGASGVMDMNRPSRRLDRETDPLRQVFDTCYAMFEYDNQDVIFEGCHWAPYMRTPFLVHQQRRGERDRFPDWIRSNRVEVLGSDAFLVISRHAGGWQVYDRSDNPIAGAIGLKDDSYHVKNFLDCMRTRERPNSDVEIAHKAMIMNHLMVASHRAGNRQVDFDAVTETITNLSEANQFLRRTGRAPYLIPDQV
jgi:predicted dehydrogenase